MNYLKKLGITIGIMALILFIATFFITTLNYFNLISGSFLSILEILIMIITLFTGGFLIGKNSKAKGWLEGLKVGAINIFIYFIINIIFIKEISFKVLLYYIILIICSILGGMIGISKKANT